MWGINVSYYIKQKQQWGDGEQGIFNRPENWNYCVWQRKYTQKTSADTKEDYKTAVLA